MFRDDSRVAGALQAWGCGRSSTPDARSRAASALRVRKPDGTWLELDHDVDRVLWPSAGARPSTEPIEAREIVYLALTGDGRVVRRTVLP